MNGAVKEIKARIGREEAKLKFNKQTWSSVTRVFVDNSVLLAEWREFTEGSE